VLPEVTRKAVDPAGAAVALDCHIDTIDRMISDGRLPAVKVGTGWRIREEDIDALLAGRLAPPVDPRIAEIIAAAPPLTDPQVDDIVAIIRADQGGER
jgi:excisionase family DNA binding protein